MAYTIDDFYVGQRVRIREGDDLVGEYGFDDAGRINSQGDEDKVLPTDVRPLCGVEVIVAKIESGSIYLAEWPGDLSNYVGANWFYYPNELEPVEEKTSIDFDEGIFYQMIGVK